MLFYIINELKPLTGTVWVLILAPIEFYIWDTRYYPLIFHCNLIYLSYVLLNREKCKIFLKKKQFLFHNVVN